MFVSFFHTWLLRVFCWLGFGLVFFFQHGSLLFLNTPLALLPIDTALCGPPPCPYPHAMVGFIEN